MAVKQYVLDNLIISYSLYCIYFFDFIGLLFTDLLVFPIILCASCCLFVFLAGEGASLLLSLLFLFSGLYALHANKTY